MLATVLDPPLVNSFPPADAGRDAVARIEPELATMRDDEVVPINLEILRACATALAALPAIRALRPAVAVELPCFPLGAIDNLEDYTRALAYAHRCIAPRRRGGQLARDVYKRASVLRNALLHHAVSLAERGHLPPGSLTGVPRGSSYTEVAQGAVALGRLLSLEHPAIAGRADVDLEECERAETTGRHLASLVGDLPDPSTGGMTAKLALRLRTRCFTLFVGAYDRCRQAATYLRWAEGDADSCVPSLYRKRRAG